MPSLPEAVGHAVSLLRAIHRGEPPDLPAPSPAGAASLGALAAQLLGLGQRQVHEVLRLLFLPARDFVEETVGSGRGASAGVEAEAVRALLCGAAVRALSEGPFAPGTLFGLLHHLALDDGPFRSTVKGGVGALARGLAEAARGFGVEIRTGVPGPIRIDVEEGVARGARLGDGERIAAEAVVSDHDTRTTLTRMLPPGELDPEVHRALRGLRYRGSVARVHLALRALPQFEGLPPDALRGTLVVAPSVAAIERAWDQAKRGAVPSHPYVEVTIPTVADPGLAPDGQHVLDAWIQYVPHGRADRNALVKIVIEELAPFAPDLPGLVLHQAVSLPEDLEARFGLAEGHLYGGEVRLDQAFFLRSAPSCAGYESPIPNLYLGGSAGHPGGYSGRSGWNLAGRLSSPAAGR
jgi:phytoene dehydrogenase-like protein